MTTVFRPPYRWYDPPVAADTPEIDMVPAKYFSNPDGLIPVGVNVFVTNAGVVSEIQPPHWEDIATVYWGGHENGPLSAAEIALLTAAGYAANLHTDTTVVTPPTGGGSGSGYGAGGFGTQGYGV